MCNAKTLECVFEFDFNMYDKKWLLKYVENIKLEKRKADAIFVDLLVCFSFGFLIE